MLWAGVGGGCLPWGLPRGMCLARRCLPAGCLLRSVFVQGDVCQGQWGVCLGVYSLRPRGRHPTRGRHPRPPPRLTPHHTPRRDDHWSGRTHPTGIILVTYFANWTNNSHIKSCRGNIWINLLSFWKSSEQLNWCICSLF